MAESDLDPQVSTFINIVFSPEKQATVPLQSFSHEELYRNIYQICWKGEKQKLYEGIIGLARTLMLEQQRQLETIHTNPQHWLTVFGTICINHDRGVDIIASVCAYLDRNYVQYELRTNLSNVLRQMIQDIFIAAQIAMIFSAFRMVATRNLPVDEAFIRKVADVLYKLEPDNVHLNPSLFQQLLPSVAPSNIAELQALYNQLEARQAILDVKSSGTDNIGGVKRDAEMAGILEMPDAKRPVPMPGLA